MCIRSTNSTGYEITEGGVHVHTHVRTHTCVRTHTTGVFSFFVLLSLIVKLSEWVEARALEAERVAALNVSSHRGAQRAIGDNSGGNRDGDYARSLDRYVLRGVAFDPCITP